MAAGGGSGFLSGLGMKNKVAGHDEDSTAGSSTGTQVHSFKILRAGHTQLFF